MSARAIDVSDLEHGTADSRALLWWGNLSMMVIEGTMFAMLVATYLYLRTVNLDWPPATVIKPDLTLPTVNLLIMLLSCIPMLIADKAAKRGDVTAVRIGFAICIAAGIAILAIRSMAFANLGYKWSDHAFGSIVWVVIGMHLFHVIVATGENLMILVYMMVWPPTKKRYLDVRCAAVYWYFVILSWLPFFILIFVQPWMHRKGT